MKHILNVTGIHVMKRNSPLRCHLRNLLEKCRVINLNILITFQQLISLSCHEKKVLFEAATQLWRYIA